MNCKHENNEVIDSSCTLVSVHGAELLLELMRCEDCGYEWVQPYLSLAPVDIETEKLIVSSDHLLPSKSYVMDVIGVKFRAIPEELVETWTQLTSDSRIKEGKQ